VKQTIADAFSNSFVALCCVWEGKIQCSIDMDRHAH
jgi:hypothetical protein